jgi:(1->4)-alpha-D-glucan 1-alpha-D-glucosylmutase
VPDFYQGSELWDLSLVDPDNRRPVDYARRRALLGEIDQGLQAGERAGLVARLMAHPEDDRLKLFATTGLLRFRRDRRHVFDGADYAAVAVTGARREHVFAFTRALGDEHILVAVPRLIAALAPDGTPPLGERVWSDTTVTPGVQARSAYRDVLTDRLVPIRRENGRPHVRAADLFEHFPIACLEAL